MARVYQNSRRTTKPSEAVVRWATKNLSADITFGSFFYFVCRGGDHYSVPDQGCAGPVAFVNRGAPPPTLAAKTGVTE